MIWVSDSVVLVTAIGYAEGPSGSLSPQPTRERDHRPCATGGPLVRPRVGMCRQLGERRRRTGRPLHRVLPDQLLEGTQLCQALLEALAVAGRDQVGDRGHAAVGVVGIFRPGTK